MPVGPVFPVKPVGPVSPVKPVEPVTTEAAPVAPVMPVGPVTVDAAPVLPVAPVGPSIPSKFTLYTFKANVPAIFVIESITIAPVPVVYDCTRPSNLFAELVESTTITEFPAIYARPVATVKETELP
jgi:hypothetical protein